MSTREDEPRATVLPYRTAGAERDNESTPADPWLVTSWAAFVASLLVVIGGVAWVFRSGPTDRYADGIAWAIVIVVMGLASIACLLGTSIALLLNRGRRNTALALIPWTLTILTCAAPLAIAILR